MNYIVWLIVFLFHLHCVAMEAELHESKRQEHAKLALFQNGFSNELIEKLCELKPEDITAVAQLDDSSIEKTGKSKIYQAFLKNGDIVIADCCQLEGQQKKRCTRLVQIPKETKFVIELPLKPSYYAMIEKQFANQAE
ncbi:hypothetical protein HYX58_02755 [Candidatus Dependentiae bacterium]|nr:hypothetical protein [Candidatus Dependentiae bacterium]